jgi:hypothetical protein
MNATTVSIPLKDDDFQVSGWCGNRPKCVQVAIKPEGVAVRDSKDGSKTTLTFTHDEWDAFVKGVKDGQFNPLT